MTSLDRLRQLVPTIYGEYFAACRLAEQARPREQHAATVIQKYARGFLTRLHLDELSIRVVCIQRVWRGYLGRQRAHLAREARDKRLREEYFACMATMIQRHWRGFWSRKHVFDFGARKQYLARVAEVNSKMRAVLAEEGERAAYEQKALAQSNAHAAFEDRVNKLHHLISTASQPGIFASPYAVAAGTLPVIAGLPVEQHLKAAFKKTAPASLLSRTSPARAGHSTFLPPINAAGAANPKRARTGPQMQPAITLQVSQEGLQTAMDSAAGIDSQQGEAGYALNQSGSDVQGSCQAGIQIQSSSPTGAAGVQPSPRGRLRQPAYPQQVLMLGTGQLVPSHTTLRQAVPYDVVHQAENLDKKVVRAEMMMRHTQPFTHTLHVPDHPTIATQSNRNLEGYHDPWDPTIGGRMETFSATQANISPTRFAKYPSKQPYFDTSLLPDADTLPLKTYQPHYQQRPVPSKPAGFSNAERCARALKPAR